MRAKPRFKKSNMQKRWREHKHWELNHQLRQERKSRIQTWFLLRKTNSERGHWEKTARNEERRKSTRGDGIEVEVGIGAKVQSAGEEERGQETAERRKDTDDMDQEIVDGQDQERWIERKRHEKEEEFGHGHVQWISLMSDTESLDGMETVTVVEKEILTGMVSVEEKEMHCWIDRLLMKMT